MPPQPRRLVCHAVHGEGVEADLLGHDHLRCRNAIQWNAFATLLTAASQGEYDAHFQPPAYPDTLWVHMSACRDAKEDMSRTDAIARARDQFRSGAFFEELARRVAYRTESQNAERGAELRAYLEQELQPAFAELDFESRLIESPSGKAPFLVAAHHESASAPTVLMYGHGDVVDGMAD